MELVGVYAAYVGVSQMVAQGKLPAAPAAILTATLSLHGFNIWHCCSHGGLAQHSEEHEAFENMVSRLAGLLMHFSDSDIRGHKLHHLFTNTPADPDLWMKDSSLSEMGSIMFQHFEARDVGPSKWEQLPPGFRWEEWALVNAADEAIHLLRSQEETRSLGDLLQMTFLSACKVSFFLLILFFGRYPHRGGVSSRGTEENEINTFYETTFRGQGQVDLWMMGEGWHHGHHAANDVNYTVLAKVGAEVEQRHPHIKAASRGNADLAAMEAEPLPPPRLNQTDPVPDQVSWERTLAVRAVIDCLVARSSEPDATGSALTSLAGIAIENALRIATTADFSLLRHLHSEMGFKDKVGVLGDADPLPVCTWHETVLSQRTQEMLREKAREITAHVVGATAQAAAVLPPSVCIAQKSDIKQHYLEFFKAVGNACIAPASLRSFLDKFAGEFPEPKVAGEGPEVKQLSQRVQDFLESPIKRDFLHMRSLPETSEALARQRVADVLGWRPLTSRL